MRKFASLIQSLSDKLKIFIAFWFESFTATSMTISIEALEEAIQIKKQIAELEAKLQRILAGTAEPKSKRGRKKTKELLVVEEEPEVVAKPAKKRKRKLSPEARERISEAQKARWAANRKA